MRRRLIEMLERRKEQMISSLWSNSNYDDDKGTRRQAIQEIEEHYQEVIDSVNGITREGEIDQDNPFFDASQRGVARIAPLEKVPASVAPTPDYFRGDTDQ